MRNYSKTDGFGLHTTNIDNLDSGSFCHFCNAEKCCRQTFGPRFYSYNTRCLEE